MLPPGRRPAAGDPGRGLNVVRVMTRPQGPAPDGYLAAAARLGFPPDQTIVIEDSAAGIAAGRAAGAATVIGVGARARSARPDFVVQDLRQIRWRQGRLQVACPAGPSPR